MKGVMADKNVLQLMVGRFGGVQHGDTVVDREPYCLRGAFGTAHYNYKWILNEGCFKI